MLWTVICHDHLSVGFSRQEYRSGLPTLPPRGYFQPRDQTHISCGFCIAGGLFIAEPLGKLFYNPISSEAKSLSCVRLFATRGLQPTKLLRSWDSPGKNTGVSCHFLLQEIFPTQESNPGLPHYRQTL